MADSKTSELRPIASLTPRLLARKGGAKPAMRPQSGALAATFDEFAADDLGWNDMGHDADLPPNGELTRGEVVSIDSAGRMSAPGAAAARAPRAAGPDRSLALAAGRRAAFTLRVDAARHLQLRLACTVQGRSAQALVTEAIDRLLAEQPEIAELAAQVTRNRS